MPKISKWATSAGGNPIDLHLSSENPTHPILLIGGVHGDEPEGVHVAEKTLDLLVNPPRHLESAPQTPWALITCLNPDGYLKTPRTRMNASGVDLNRNFPSKDWTPDSKGPRYFPGRHAASEPEIMALVKLIENIRPRVIIHCHSDSVACNVFTGAPGKFYADIFSEVSGYPPKEDIGYPTPGSLGQYGWFEKKIPVICLEEKERIAISEVWPHYEAAMERVFFLKK